MDQCVGTHFPPPKKHLFCWLINEHDPKNQQTVGVGCLHLVLFYSKWIGESALYKALKLHNVMGQVALLAIFLLAVFSSNPVRRTYYCFFRFCHLVLVPSVFVLVLLHHEVS